MAFNPLHLANRLLQRVAALSTPSPSADFFEQARIKINIKLTIVFFSTGILYGLSLIYRGYFLLASFTVISSFALLTIPLFLIKDVKKIISYSIYFIAGICFAAFNIFGSGNSTGTAVMFWIVFVIHLAFVVLNRKAALIFSIVILILFLIKKRMITEGLILPFWIDETMVNNPKLIDLLMPVFVNFYLAYITNHFYEQARLHVMSSKHILAELSEQVRESEKKYRLIVDKGLSYMAIHSLEGKILFTNDACAQALGCIPTELYQMKIQDFLDDSVRLLYNQHIDDIKSNGYGAGIMKVKKKSGEGRFWDFRNVLVSEPDKDDQVVGFAHDVTELVNARKKLEESYDEMKQMTLYLTEARQRAEESDKLKSLFIANISHEIRTPMNAIMGFSELLERPSLTEAKRMEFTHLIRERSHDLLNIINNVLDISKIEAGQVSITEMDGNVDELMDRILAGVKAENRYLQGKDIDFRKSNLLNVSEYKLHLDFIRLNQVLSNLLTNAIKFTKQGFIELECKIQTQGMLLFTVRDTGVGIAQEKIDRLFRPFRQADENVHKQYGGSGLGLAISKGLVELMGGKIWVESKLNEGSSFYFTVALKKSEPERNSGLLGEKVLVVEDDPQSNSYYCEIIDQQGMKSIPVFNGADATKLLECQPEIKLVLLDLGLPDMSGIEVAKNILKNVNVKVIILTGLGENDIKEKVLGTGVHGFMTKPVNSKNLIEKIKQLMP